VGERRRGEGGERHTAERREGANDVLTRILHECGWDHLEGVCDGMEGSLLDAGHRTCAWR